MMRYDFDDDLWALKYVLWNWELRYVLWLLRKVKDFIIWFMNYEGEMLLNESGTWKQKNDSFIAWSMAINMNDKTA
jgi:hypothetical protein